MRTLEQCETANAPEMRRRRDFFRVRIPNGVHKRDIYSDLMRLILPAALEFILIQMVNMFDQIQVGVLGEHALSAVGLATQVRLVYVALYFAINVGVTALVARAVGEGKRDEPVRYLENGLLIIFILAVTTSTLGLFFTEEILRLFGVPDERTLIAATEYLQICMIGYIPLAMASTITAALRGVGNTRAPLIYNTAANVVNVVLNWLLITGRCGFPALGMRGAAIATAIGQLMMFVLGVAACYNPKNGLRIRFQRLLLNPERKYIEPMLRIGVPAMGEQLTLRLGVTMFTRTVASLGSTLYAAHSVCTNIHSLSFLTGMAFSVASTTLCGQSLGKRRPDVAVLYCNYSCRLNLLVSAGMMAVFILLGEPLMRLYSQDAALIAAGMGPLLIAALMQPFAGLFYVFSGALRGAADTRSVARITILATLGCRPILAYVAVFHLGWSLIGVWIALALDQVLCVILLALRYTSYRWVTILDKN